jgi:FkbM family methyltransferase
MKNGFFTCWERRWSEDKIKNSHSVHPELNKNKLSGNYFIDEIKFNTKEVVCVDVGAAQGYFILKNHEKFDRIYAFEPCYPNYVKLAQNLNDLRINEKKHVAFFNVACSGNEDIKIGNFQFCNYKSPYGSSLVDINALKKSNSQHSVFFLSLDNIFTLIGEDRINFLKCDIEGSEFDFFYGKDISRIDVISMELHRSSIEKKSVKCLINHFEKSGFKVHYLSKKTNGECLFINKEAMKRVSL